MSTICLTSPTLTSIRVASSPTVITTTSNVVTTPEGHFTNVTFTTCAPVGDTPIFRRQQGCSVVTTSTFIPGVPVTRQVAVRVTTTQVQTFATTLFGTSCSVSSLPVSPSSSSSSSSVSSISDPSSSQTSSQPSSTSTRASSLRVVPVPIATSGSSTLYSYSTSYVAASDTADGAQATDTAVEPPSQDSYTNRVKVVGSVCGSILGAVLLGVAGYFLFKKLTHAYKHKSEDRDYLRQIDPEPQVLEQQTGYSGLDPHYDQTQGAPPHLQDPTGQGDGGSLYTYDGMQGSFTPDASGQGQGGYAYPYGQDAGQYTYMQGPESQGVQGQGMDYSNGQGQGTGVEQYNAYGGQPDGMQQHYAPQPNDLQSQNPFSDGPGPQDQMSQVPFGAAPLPSSSVQAAAVGGSASFGLVLPAATVAHRYIFGKRNSADPFRASKQQYRPNPF